MAKKAANRVVESNNSNKVFELGKYYHLIPSTIECDLNQGYVPAELQYTYTVTTDEGTVEMYSTKTVDLDCTNVLKKEIRLVDVYVTLKDGDDEVVSSMTIMYTCIPTGLEVTYCVDESSVKTLYLSKDGKRWVEKGIVPKEGGSVLVVFRYVKYEKQVEDGSETVNIGSYEELIDIPPCICEENSNCGGILEGEIEFKQAHNEGCNIVKYTVEQETCFEEENK